jgi:uncharacterized paraquat-inducible protein A
MAHEHGKHTCYCPGCNYEIDVDAYTKCNTLTCPQCGERMRAKETGELRNTTASIIAAKEVLMPTSVKTLTSLPCSVCNFPILIPEDIQEGQQIKCPSCGAIHIAQNGITIPKTVFWSMITFAAGVLLGPAIWATTKGGSEWLAKKARERLA